MPGLEEELCYFAHVSHESVMGSYGAIVRQFNPERIEGCRGYTDRELVGFVRDRDYNMLKRFGDFDENSGDTIVLSLGATVGRWGLDFGPGSQHNLGGQLRRLNKFKYGDKITVVASLLEGMDHAIDKLTPLVKKKRGAPKNSVPNFVRIRTDSQDLIDILASHEKCQEKWPEGDMSELQDLCKDVDDALQVLWEDTNVVVQLWLVEKVDIDESF